jgi:hypothetical protein
MKLELVVQHSDGTETTATVKAVDIVAFEQHFDMSMSRLEKEIRMTHLFFLAHHAMKRTGETKDDFEKWIDGIENVIMGEAKK